MKLNLNFFKKFLSMELWDKAKDDLLSKVIEMWQNTADSISRSRDIELTKKSSKKENKAGKILAKLRTKMMDGSR